MLSLRIFFGLLCLISSSAQGATVTWISDTDGNWSAGANWSTGTAPAAADDVVISRSGVEVTVTLDVFATVNSLTSEENLHLAGGDLTLRGTSQINGMVTGVNGRKVVATGAGVVVTLAGNTTLDEVGLNAHSGATLRAPNVTAASMSAGGTVDWRAENLARLELPALESVSLTTVGCYFVANAGGTLDLSSLSSMTPGRCFIYSLGAGSLLDLGSLTAYEGVVEGNSIVQIMDGGELRLNPALQQLRRVDLNVRGTSVVNIDQLVSVRQGSLTFNNHAVDFDALTTLEDVDITVQNGADVLLSALASYSAVNISRTWYVNGTGSALSFPSLTELIPHTGNVTHLYAQDGGQMELPLLETVPPGRVFVTAQGSGASVDLGALEEMPATPQGKSRFHANQEGTISLSPLFSALDYTDLYLQGDGVFPVSQIAAFRNAEMSIREMDVSFVALDTLESAGIFAYNGAQADFPVVTSYTVSSTSSVSWYASGLGTILSFPALDNLTLSEIQYHVLNAESGGSVSLPIVAGIAAGRLLTTSSGAGSVINLPALTELNATGNNPSVLAANNGGEIRVASTFDSTVNTQLNFAGGGIFPFNQLVRMTGGSITGNNQSITFPVLEELQRVSLYATGGAVLTFPALERFIQDTGASSTFYAEGTGSRLALDALTDLQLSLTQYLALDARNGGYIDLSSLITSSAGRLFVTASGSGTVDLSGLPQLPADDDLLNGYQTGGNGSILLSGALTQLEDVSLTFQGTSAFPFEQITGLNGVTLRVEGGADIALPNVTTVEDTTVYVLTGSELTLPALETYTANASETWNVSGPGASLSFPDLTQIMGDEINGLYIEATTQGELNLPELTSTSGKIFFRSAGAGSVLNMPELTSTLPEGSGRGSFRAQDGGEIRLGAGYTDLTHMDLLLENGGLFPDAQLTTMTASVVTLYAQQIEFDALTTAVDMDVFANNASQVSFPVLANISNTGTMRWWSNGAGSTFAAPQLREVALNDTAAWDVDVYNGGTMDLAGLQELGRGRAAFAASNSGSLLDLSALVRYDSAKVSFDEFTGGVLLITYHPDFQISRVAAPASLAQGANFNVDWDMSNSGFAAYAGELQTCFYLSTDNMPGSDILVGCSTNAVDVNPDTATTLQFGVTLPAVAGGSYFLLTVADANNAVMENRDGDNFFARAITVQGSEGEGEGEGETPFDCPGDCALPGQDADGDGLTDACELNCTLTDPEEADTDGDSLSDGLEFEEGLDPLRPDTDGDGMADGYEYAYRVSLDPGDNSDRDTDADGDALSNLEEFLKISSPVDPNDPALSFYVAPAPAGEDTLPGGSLDQPWATVQFALEHVSPTAEQPVRILLREAEYTEDVVLLPHVTVAAVLDESPSIVGTVTGAEGAGLTGLTLFAPEDDAVVLNVEDVRMTMSGVVFSGLNTSGATGLLLRGDGSAGTIVESCIFEHLANGVDVFGPLPILRRSRFSELSGTAILVRNTGKSAGAAMAKALGDAADPATGWNAFDLGTIEGLAVVNERDEEIKLESNDWLTDNADEIASALDEGIDFEPFLPKNSAILAAALYCTVWSAETQAKIEDASVDLKVSSFDPVTQNTQGVYAFPAIADGSYSVTADAPGFEALEEAVEIEPGGVHSVILALREPAGGEGEGEGEGEEPAPCCLQPNKDALPTPGDLLVGLLSFTALLVIGAQNWKRE